MHPGSGVAKLVNEFAWLRSKSEMEKRSVKHITLSIVQLTKFSCIGVRCLYMGIVLNWDHGWHLNNGVLQLKRMR